MDASSYEKVQDKSVNYFGVLIVAMVVIGVFV